MEQIQHQLSRISNTAESDDQLSTVQLVVKNTSGVSMNSPHFDIYVVVNPFLISHPLLSQQYQFNGLWKPEIFDGRDEYITIIMVKVISNWEELETDMKKNDLL